MVVVENLCKSYGEFKIENESFTVNRGEIFTLIGESGSGKSTILRLIGGLDSDYTGTVLVEENSPLQGLKRGLVGVVFQDSLLLNHLNIDKNIEFGGKFKSIDSKTLEERKRLLIELLQLDGLEKKFPSQLSGGEKQRVNIARALIGAPKLLLMDEAFSALDKPLRVKLQREIVKIKERLGVTIIFVTHDQEEAFAISDRMAILKEGKIIQIGTPYEIYNGPKNIFVARFLGVENFFDKLEFKEIFNKNIEELPNFDMTLNSHENSRTMVDLTLNSDENNRIMVAIKSEDLRVIEEMREGLNCRVLIDSFLYKNGYYEIYARSVEAPNKTINIRQNRVDFYLDKGKEVILNIREQDLLLLRRD